MAHGIAVHGVTVPYPLTALFTTRPLTHPETALHPAGLTALTGCTIVTIIIGLPAQVICAARGVKFRFTRVARIHVRLL